MIFFATLRRGDSAFPGRAADPSGKMICIINLLPLSLFGLVRAAVVVGVVVVAVLPELRTLPPTKPEPSVGVGVVVVDGVVLGVSEGSNDVTEGDVGAFGTAGKTG